MKNYHTLKLIFTLMMASVAPGIEAQERWSVELRPGVHFTTKEFGGIDLKTGIGIEGSVAYRFMTHLGGYAGWSWNRFASDSDRDYEETGYSFGLQFVHPFPNSRLSYVLKAGATYNHIETEDSTGAIIYDTGHGLGWEVGTGVRFRLAKQWFLTPEIRYRSLSRDLNSGAVNTSANLDYISTGVGLSYSF